MHGGASTGPRTAAGLQRLRAARTTHGRTTAEMRAGHRFRLTFLRRGRVKLQAYQQEARLPPLARLRLHALPPELAMPPYPPRNQPPPSRAEERAIAQREATALAPWKLAIDFAKRAGTCRSSRRSWCGRSIASSPPCRHQPCPWSSHPHAKSPCTVRGGGRALAQRRPAPSRHAPVKMVQWPSPPPNASAGQMRNATPAPARRHADPSRSGLRALFAAPGFARLWAIGGCVNAMRWFEVLVAALFTFDLTGSEFAVALVSAARTIPMPLLGAFAGVMSESVNRKHILVAGQLVSAAASASIAILGLLGLARPWHIGVAALVSGTVWSTEMSTRRRMIGESAPPGMVPRALALDAATNSLTRMVGPVAAGALYQVAGVGAAFSVSAAIYLIAALFGMGLRHRQEKRQLAISQVPRELAEGFRLARGHTVIAGVLMVTIAMNLLAFPYSALIAPIGREHFMVSATLVGVLAAAESVGAFLGGMWLAGGDRATSGRVLMVSGSLLYTVCVALMPLAPVFPIACLLLVAGGLGSAAFANMQSALIITHAPPHIRSRLMGLLTVCIGMGPLGILLVGTLARFLARCGRWTRSNSAGSSRWEPPDWSGDRVSCARRRCGGARRRRRLARARADRLVSLP